MAVITAVTIAVLKAGAITTGILAFLALGLESGELAPILGAQPVSQVRKPSSPQKLRSHSLRQASGVNAATNALQSRRLVARIRSRVRAAGYCSNMPADATRPERG